MADFTTEWKETKVVMSVTEFDRYRAMEQAIKERKVYRVWEDTGGYGRTWQASVVEESDVINELTEQIHKLTEELYNIKRKKQMV